MNHSKKCKRVFQTNFAAEDMKFVIQLEEKDIYLPLLKWQTRSNTEEVENTLTIISVKNGGNSLFLQLFRSLSL